MKTLKIAVISVMVLFVSISLCKAQDILDTNSFNRKMFNEIMTVINNSSSATTDIEKQDMIKQGIEDMAQNSIDEIKNEETKYFMQGMLNEAKNYPETFFEAQEAFLKNALYVYPNPSDGNNVTLEFYTHNWKFHFEPMRVNNADIELFYNGNQLAKLTYNNIQDNKVIIDKKHLTQKGTYTICFDGGTTNFIVR